LFPTFVGATSGSGYSNRLPLKVERLVAKTFEVGRAAFDDFFSLNKNAPPGFSSRAL